MSITGRTRVTCPCGVELEAFVAGSLNATRHPHLREALLAGRLHRFQCAGCGGELLVEASMFYFDFARRQFLGVFPRTELPSARAHAEATVAAFDKTLGAEAPAPLQAVSDDFLVRVCFGYDELREKIVLEDAGLGDLAIEELKCRVLAADPMFERAGVLTLRFLARNHEDGALIFAPERWTLPLPGVDLPPPQIAVDPALYDDVAALSDDDILRVRPGLASGPHVSLLRLLAR